MGAFYFYWTFLLLCSAYSFTKGGPPERVAMAIAVAASVASLVAYRVSGLRFSSVETGIFVIDMIAFAAFLLLTLWADRFWPLWITGIHLVAIATHTAKLLTPTVVPWVYSWIQSIWSYPVLALIVAGAVRHQKRLRLHGVDRSWSGSFAAVGLGRPRNGPTG